VEPDTLCDGAGELLRWMSWLGYLFCLPDTFLFDEGTFTRAFLSPFLGSNNQLYTLVNGLLLSVAFRFVLFFLDGLARKYLSLYSYLFK
jgi:hypothetical protein